MNKDYWQRQNERIIMIEEGVLNLIFSSQYEDYEAGVDDPFTRGFEAFIKKYGNEFLGTFKLSDYRFTVDALQAAIEVIGRVQDADTVMYRTWILTSYISHDLPVIRDAASMAISDLLGSRSIDILQDAIDNESNISLKNDMQLLLDELME